MRVFEYYYFIFFLVSNVDYVFTLCMYVSIYIYVHCFAIFTVHLLHVYADNCVYYDMFRLLCHTMICNPGPHQAVYPVVRQAFS